MQGIEPVEALGGGEILAFGRMQGGGMMQVSAQPGGIDGNFFCATDNEKVREDSDKLLPILKNGYKKLGEE